MTHQFLYFALSVPLSLPTLPVRAYMGTAAVGGYELRKVLKKALSWVGLAMPTGASCRLQGLRLVRVGSWSLAGLGDTQGCVGRRSSYM